MNERRKRQRKRKLYIFHYLIGIRKDRNLSQVDMNTREKFSILKQRRRVIIIIIMRMEILCLLFISQLFALEN